MTWLAKVRFYLGTLLTRRKLDEQLTEEVRTHVEMATEANVARGMPPDEAHYAALREFGNVASIQEQTRDEHGWVWVEQWAKDFRFSVRSLMRDRGFTLTALATLVVGIGVATVVFDLTSWILFRADPYPHPEQLYRIGYKDKQIPFAPDRPGLYFQAYQEQVNVFSEYAAVQREMANVVVDGEPTALEVVSASVDCFRTLGIVPQSGRTFLPEEFKSGANRVVVISDHFWRRNFQADPEILGRNLLIDQQVCTVVGVLKQDQQFPPAFEGEVYRPLVFTPDPAMPFDTILLIIGRLRPGVSREAALTALAGVKVAGLPNWAVPFFAGQEVALARPSALARPEAYWVMAIAAAFLYLIACLNTINLMLVRLIGRQRELSIRLAVGASRGRIVRLLVIESVGLTLAVMVILVFAARWLFPPLFAQIYNDESLSRSFWTWETLGCIALLSFLAGLAGILIPVLRLLKTDLNPSMKESGSSMGESRRLGRIRNLLVVLQAAFAVILLNGTGLMVRSFEKLQQVNLGFEPNGMVKARIAFPKGYELKPEARLHLFERLRERLRKLPGVRAVSCDQDALLEGGFWGTAQVKMPGGEFEPVAGNFVSTEFLKTSGLVIKKGRWFSGKQGVLEVVLNESFAKKRFGSEDPIGQSIQLLVSGDTPLPVVGVVGDVKETVRTISPGMRFYTPSWVYPPNINMVLFKLDRNPGKEFAGVVRHAIYDFDPKLIVTNVNSIDELVGNSMWAERFAYTIMKGLTTIALGLVIVGMFSVVAYTVASRRQEFGVRLALGAGPTDLHRLVMKRGILTVAIGVGVGTLGALGLTRFMQSLLFETTPNDPVVYLVVAGVLLIAAIFACWLPARRAASTDPVIALRAE